MGRSTGKRRSPLEYKAATSTATILCLICFMVHGLASGISSIHSSSLGASLLVISAGHPSTVASLPFYFKSFDHRLALLNFSSN